MLLELGFFPSSQSKSGKAYAKKGERGWFGHRRSIYCEIIKSQRSTSSSWVDGHRCNRASGPTKLAFWKRIHQAQIETVKPNLGRAIEKCYLCTGERGRRKLSKSKLNAVNVGRKTPLKRMRGLPAAP